ncbi:hypothetical protein FACS1894186_5260 [Alphaproteobacteria bacterium]|nr:hypothetical protein FACS1894186_5260 [Alphaproteobacteria bacterium]
MRIYFRQIIPGLIGGALAAFFMVHIVAGDRGLLSMRRLTEELARDKASLAEVRRQEAAYARRVHLLSPKGLDQDMLEESARSILGYAEPADLVAFQ